MSEQGALLIGLLMMLFYVLGIISTFNALLTSRTGTGENLAPCDDRSQYVGRHYPVSGVEQIDVGVDPPGADASSRLLLGRYGIGLGQWLPAPVSPVGARSVSLRSSHGCGCCWAGHCQ